MRTLAPIPLSLVLAALGAGCTEPQEVLHPGIRAADASSAPRPCAIDAGCPDDGAASARADAGLPDADPIDAGGAISPSDGGPSDAGFCDGGDAARADGSHSCS